MSQQAFINLAQSNSYLFPNAQAGDLGILTGTSNQSILVGVSNAQSVLKVTSSNITTSNINLGINKSNPAFPLDVNGDLNFSGTLRQGGVPYVGSQWSNNSSNVFILTSNVGIQKSNPAFPLDVNGDLNFSGTLRQGGVPYVGSQWSNNSSNVFLFSSNVGLGLSNPQAQLHLTSNLRVDGSLNINQSLALSGLQFTMTGQLQNSTQVYAYTSNIQGLSNLVWGPSNGIRFSLPSSSSNDVFQFSTPTSNIMTFRGNGDITVAGNLALSNNLLLNGFVVTQRASSIINNLTTSTPYTAGATGATFSVASNNSNTYFKFQGNTTEVARLTGDGKFGIGNANPQYPLDVSGIMRVGGGTANSPDMIVGNTLFRTYNKSLTVGVNDYTNICITSCSSGAYSFDLTVVQSESYSSVAKMYKVSISFNQMGNSSYYKLLPISASVFNAQDFDVEISMNGNVTTLRLVRISGNVTSANYTCSLILYQSQAQQVTITDSTTSGTGATNSGIFSSTPLALLEGKVGIAKSNPAYPLDVAGDVNFTGSLRQNGVQYIPVIPCINLLLNTSTTYTSGSWNILVVNSVANSSGGIWTYLTNTVTCGKSGMYVINMKMQFLNCTALFLGYSVNQTVASSYTESIIGNAAYWGNSVFYRYLNSGDVIRFLAKPTATQLVTNDYMSTHQCTLTYLGA